MTMMRRMMEKKKKNKGVAMVMVIIAIAFVGMLVAMVLYMSYANFIMKSNDRRAKDNFYTAESALDIIHAGLEKDVSDCMSQAYVKVMQTSSGMTTEEMTARFRSLFVQYLSGPKFLQGSDATKYNINHLIDMWRDVVPIATVEGGTGAWLSANLGANNMIVSASNNYIKLENLHVVFTDANGYVSIINTDIAIETPSMDFAQATNRLTLENYSLIANTSLVSDSLNASSGAASTMVTGNVFGGYDGITLANQNSLSFEIDPTDAGDGQPHSYNLAAESINLDNVLSGSHSFDTDEYYKTFVEDINVSTGRISLSGETYVSDDMDISGKRSSVTLKGKYIGYGNSDSGSLGSSSILINGADTVLNFAGLEKLMLSGHAYVGAMKYDADKDRQAAAINAVRKPEDALVTGDSINASSDKITDIDDYKKNADLYDETTDAANAALPEGAAKKESVPQNLSDAMMGESISVKANQLLYLVPSECVGYIRGKDTQVVTKNPMTYDEYKMLAETEEEVVDNDNNPVIDTETGLTKKEKKYDVARLDQLWAKLGGTNYTDKYKAVYRRVNGTVMVYLYLDFANEQMANQFYRAYFDYDPEGISNYVSSYVSSITWNNAVKNGGDSKLSLAANAFDIDEANHKVVMIRDNNDSEHTGAFIDRLTANEDYTKKYTALMHSTSDDYTVLSVAAESQQIFDNYVKLSDLQTLQGLYEDTTTDATAVLKYYENGNGTLIYPDECRGNTHAIITNGNVIVKGNYEGLILARGTIYLSSGCATVRYNPSATINAFRAKKTAGGEDHYAYEVFGKSGELSYGVLTPGDDEDDDKDSDPAIKIGELITYEHWKKD